MAHSQSSRDSCCHFAARPDLLPHFLACSALVWNEKQNTRENSDEEKANKEKNSAQN